MIVTPGMAAPTAAHDRVAASRMAHEADAAEVDALEETRVGIRVPCLEELDRVDDQVGTVLDVLDAVVSAVGRVAVDGDGDDPHPGQGRLEVVVAEVARIGGQWLPWAITTMGTRPVFARRSLNGWSSPSSSAG